MDLETEVCGINFPSPIGAAAGLDRNAEFLDALFRVGFGYVEIGSITPSTERRLNNKPEKIDSKTKKCIQVGVEERRGMLWAAHRLMENKKGPRGANIQPANETIKAVPYLCDDEYLFCFNELYPLVDYFTLNLASNHINKLHFYRKEQTYRELFKKIVRERDIQIGLQIAASTGLESRLQKKPRVLIPPIFVKIDNNGFDAKNLVNACKEEGIDGIILSGTNETGEGGEILAQSATNKLIEFRQYTKGDLVLVSSGGINSGQEALKRLKAGASLVQIYSAVNLEGYGVVSRITQELEEALKAQGFKNIKEAVGADFK